MPRSVSPRALQKVMRMNMGDVAKAVFEQVLTNDANDMPSMRRESEAVIRTHVTIGSQPDGPDWIASMRTGCKEVVDARNDLVHHFLRQHRRESVADLHAALDALDARHAAALELRNEIVALARSLAEHLRESAAYIASDEGQQALELAMSEGNLVEVLADVAQSRPAPMAGHCSPPGRIESTPAYRQMPSVRGTALAVGGFGRCSSVSPNSSNLTGNRCQMASPGRPGRSSAYGARSPTESCRSNRSHRKIPKHCSALDDQSITI